MPQIELIQGDITTISVDAIVNAANNGLKGGGGVDGAIHRVGGPRILEECIKIGYCATGEVVMTSAGNLPARYVIHTVGPVWHGGDQQEDKLLANAYRNSITLAKETEVQSISFPNISTGIYGFPKELAAEIALKVVSEMIDPDKSNMNVVFVCFDVENFDIYRRKMRD